MGTFTRERSNCKLCLSDDSGRVMQGDKHVVKCLVCDHSAPSGTTPDEAFAMWDEDNTSPLTALSIEKATLILQGADSWRMVLSKIPQLRNQDHTAESQITTLKAFANALGFYDAADALCSTGCLITPYRQWVRKIADLRLGNRQDSCHDQLIDLALFAKRLGLLSANDVVNRMTLPRVS
tara:strand:+ start:2519 stop:3058 length:540 start_codon:yes stop_codon:yes gene_type:complete